MCTHKIEDAKYRWKNSHYWGKISCGNVKIEDTDDSYGG